MRYVVADIRLSEAHTKQVQVPPWELPILQALHGNNVEVVDEIDVEREPPEPRDEYKRLADRYANGKEEGNSPVATVYGTFDRGIDALGKEIDKAANARASSAKTERMKAFDEKAKAEREALTQRQEAERKEIERDIKAREAARKAQEKESGETADAGETLHSPTRDRASRETRETREPRGTEAKGTEQKSSR